MVALTLTFVAQFAYSGFVNRAGMPI